MDERRAPAGGAAVVERDRVLDAARAFALLVVVVAHSLAWDLSTTSPMSVLDLHPGAAGCRGHRPAVGHPDDGLRCVRFGYLGGHAHRR